MTTDFLNAQMRLVADLVGRVDATDLDFVTGVSINEFGTLVHCRYNEALAESLRNHPDWNNRWIPGKDKADVALVYAHVDGQVQLFLR
jgi:hypothetical protein